MKLRKFAVAAACVCMGFMMVGCGNHSDKNTEASKTTQEQKTAQKTTTEEKKTTTEGKNTKASATTTVVTTEAVTEFSKDTKSISMGNIMEGLNFKASGTSVTLKFQNQKDFDNSLSMVISLTDASTEINVSEQKIVDGQASYTFDGLEKGKEYYLDAYPTKIADSDEKAEKINKQNEKCKLDLIQ